MAHDWGWGTSPFGFAWSDPTAGFTFSSATSRCALNATLTETPQFNVASANLTSRLSLAQSATRPSLTVVTSARPSLLVVATISPRLNLSSASAAPTS